MSINSNTENKMSKWALFKSFLFGISFILVASINDNPSKDKVRNPASANKTKATTSFIRNPLLKHTKKLSAPMMTHIVSDSGEVSEGDTFTLTGFMKASSQMKNVEVKWIIPNDFTIVNGSKKSYITSAEAGQDYQFKITVKSNSSVNQIFHLVAKSQMGDSHFSNSSQFHTKLQNELNKSNLELYERTKSYIENSN